MGVGRGNGKRHSAKRDFVASQGSGVSVTEVVERARRQGITLSVAYVYALRRTNGAPVAGAPRQAARTGKEGSAATLARLALELGLHRAGELVAQLRRQASTLR